MVTAKTFNGTPCRRCGETLRYAANTICVACNKNRHSRRTAAEKEEHKQRCREYYRNNTQRLKQKANKRYEENPDEIKERVAEYRKNNPEMVNYFSSLKRAKLTKATPEWLDSWDQFVLQEYYYKARRLRELTGKDWHVDHIYPINGKEASGLHVPWNLQLLPAKVNLRKSNKMPEEVGYV